jgi:hypothetical protein
LQTKPLVSRITPLVQRQAIEEDEDGQLVQSKAKQTTTPPVTPRLRSRIKSLHGRGQPLSEPLKSFFTPRFGYDFSQVRLHTGNHAAETARAVNAKAFTTGSDIVFGSGAYSTDTHEGKRLLAHELSHVIQQNYSGSSNIIRRNPDCREQDEQGLCTEDYQQRMLAFALQTAGKMVRDTILFLFWLLQYMNSDRPELQVRFEGPRRYLPLRSIIRRRSEFIRGHFRSAEPNHINQIFENYLSIGRVLSNASVENTFRCVPPDCCADESEASQTYAYVHLDGQVIYLCQEFFGVIPDMRITERSVVSVGGRDPDVLARTLIHEAAHLALQESDHPGGVFGLTAGDCNNGHEAEGLTYSQAIRNAYVYDLFAICAPRYTE